VTAAGGGGRALTRRRSLAPFVRVTSVNGRSIAPLPFVVGIDASQHPSHTRNPSLNAI